MLAGLRGQRPPAYLVRDGSRYASATPGPTHLATRELELVEIIRETADAVSLVFADAGGQPLPSIRPGQFFTLLVEHEGEVLRRAYSVSSDCRARDRFALTVKRVAGGRVSAWLNEVATPGLRLRALGPSGEFGCTPEPGRTSPRKLVLIAGGSGITPMMALIRTLLPSEPGCEIALIYANRSADQAIFADALATLAAAHGQRLRIHPTVEIAAPGWTGAIGRGDSATLARLLDGEALADDPATEFLLCGPTAMMDQARVALGQRGVAAARIHAESFLAPHLAADASAQLRDSQPVTVVVGERELELVVEPGQTILEAGLAAGLDLPYSCAMGGCAACRVELVRGAVVMREPNCLAASERAAGYVLACVASPTEPCRVRVE
jgi:ring-1,2-phenylacetyl-CoA epoxidase subunit PaaE